MGSIRGGRENKCDYPSVDYSDIDIDDGRSLRHENYFLENVATSTFLFIDIEVLIRKAYFALA